jgi:hypothetical protein
VVSESAIVRVFDDGRLIAEIIPEVWLLRHEVSKIALPRRESIVGDLAVISETEAL